jgi:predicted nucleic acid-binding protein
VTNLREIPEAAWSPVVRLELWDGVESGTDRRTVREPEILLPNLAITDAVWDEACMLASQCRRAGQTAPATNVLIAACARHYGVEFESMNIHFDCLMAV